MDTRTRIILFVCCCIPLRLLLAYLSKVAGEADGPYIKIMGVVAIAISVGFMYQFIVHPTKNGAFGGDSWWNNFRPVHAFIYFTFAIMAFAKPKYAYLVLLFDIILGTGLFINHYKK